MLETDIIFPSDAINAIVLVTIVIRDQFRTHESKAIGFTYLFEVGQ